MARNKRGTLINKVTGKRVPRGGKVVSKQSGKRYIVKK